MATILAFRQGQRSFTSRSGATSPAEIVFFPGVRYERWEEPVKAVKQPKKRTRSRDRIELDD